MEGPEVVKNTEKLWEAAATVMLAAAGGLARILSAKDRKNLRVSRVFSERFISGFAGLMVLLGARSLGVTGDWLGLLSGMAGWMGPRMLDLLAVRASKSIGLETDAKIDNAKGGR